MKMNKIKLNYLIFILLLIDSILIFITGLIKFPGLLLFFGITPMMLPMYEINILHDWGGIIMIGLTLSHIALNFRWMVAMTKKFARRSE